MTAMRFALVCAFGSLFICMPACGRKSHDSGPANEDEQSLDLRLFALGYHSALESDGAPPKNKEQLLQRISSDRPINPDNYVIIWGVDLRDIADQANTILAYVKNAPTNGGFVVFADGSTRRVSAEEFNKLPKAAPINMADRLAEFSPTLKQFGDDANSNRRTKYVGKIVELKGVVIGFDSSSEFSPPKSFNDALILGTEERSANVQCVMSEPQPWSKFTIGQAVTIKGRFPSGKGLPILVGCVVLDAADSKPVMVDAESLAKAAEADLDAARRKYSEKSVIVQGEITHDNRNDSARALRLKGGPKSAVVCKFKGHGRELTKQFSPGDKVKLCAESVQLDATEVFLENCQLIVE